ncbi:MAG: hypothetical protein HQM12_18865 [SAR324 cluster bacterium]|nr:hypothetical protein [SAR324 cluster bacterium]
MLSVRGVYENGKITLLEPVPNTDKKVEVIVTLLDKSKRQKISPQKNRKDAPKEEIKFKYRTLDPRQHMRPVKESLAQDYEGEENGNLPFSDIQDVNEFARNLRDKAWRT